MPVMSDGIMSGVNWMRRNDRLKMRATVRNEQRLGQPRHADQQHVAPGKQPDQELLDDITPGRSRPWRSRTASADNSGPARRRPRVHCAVTRPCDINMSSSLLVRLILANLQRVHSR